MLKPRRPFRTRERSRQEVVDELRACCTTNDKGCWLLSGSAMNSSGHRRVQYQGRSQGAHVFVYETLEGPVPTGLDLDHLCEEPPCINPPTWNHALVRRTFAAQGCERRTASEGILSLEQTCL